METLLLKISSFMQKNKTYPTIVLYTVTPSDKHILV